MRYLRIWLMGTIAIASCFSSSTVLANEIHKDAQQVTEFGDGIQLLEPADRSGFVMSGGGGRFTYDYKSKQLTVEYDGDQRAVLHFDG